MRFMFIKGNKSKCAIFVNVTYVITHPSMPGRRGEVGSLPGGLLLVPLGQLPEEAAEPGVGGLGRS